MTFDSNFDSDDDSASMKTQTQKPIHEVRLGLIKAAVWKNEGENGARYNVTICRLYKKDKDSDKWQRSDSFGRDDLLLLAKVVDQVHSWIFAQSQENESAGKTASRDNDDR